MAVWDQMITIAKGSNTRPVTPLLWEREVIENCALWSLWSECGSLFFCCIRQSMHGSRLRSHSEIRHSQECAPQRAYTKRVSKCVDSVHDGVLIPHKCIKKSLDNGSQLKEVKHQTYQPWAVGPLGSWEHHTWRYYWRLCFILLCVLPSASLDLSQLITSY